MKHLPPRPKIKTVLILVLVVVIAYLTYITLKPAEPVYNGKPITKLLDELADDPDETSFATLKELDTNAIPYIWDNLSKNDSALRQYRIRHQFFWSSRPYCYLFPDPKAVIDPYMAELLLKQIGPSAAPGIISALHHKSESVRKGATLGIGSLSLSPSNAAEAVPALVSLLDDPSRDIRLFALISLGKLGPPSRPALPKIGAHLHSSDARVRATAAVTIWRIDADFKTAFPILTNEFSALRWQSGIILEALSEMGPLAKDAVPLLLYSLKPIEEDWEREAITNALHRIDPTIVVP